MTTITISIPEYLKVKLTKEENYSALVCDLVQRFYDSQSVETLKLKKIQIKEQYDEKLQEIEGAIIKAEREEHERKLNFSSNEQNKTEKQTSKILNIIQNLSDLLGYPATQDQAEDYLHLLDKGEVCNIWAYTDLIKNGSKTN